MDITLSYIIFLPLSSTNWHLPRAFASERTTTTVLPDCLYGDWTLCCCRCQPSTPTEGSSVWRKRHAELQGNWWNRALDSYIFSGADFMIQIWKTQQWPQNWKRSVFIPISKKGNAKECSHYCTIAHISHASKVMLKILQTRLEQYVNHELLRSRETRDQIANICWIMEKSKRVPEKKTSISALLTMPKRLTVWITINCGKLWERWEYQTTWPASSEICMQVRKQQLKLDMEQQTGFK